MADVSPWALDRRQFLVAGGLLFAAGAGTAVAGTRGPAEPRPAGELPELPDLAVRPAADGVLEATLTAAPLGTAGRLGYNGSAPGPVLRLREGDRVRLTFRNDTGAHSSLHLHGLPLPPDVDAPLAHLMPGKADLREFTVPAGAAGTSWYHPHAHGDVERQLLAGLAGVVVVTGPLDAAHGLAGVDDRVVVLTRIGRDVVANGALRPVLRTRAGAVRLRLVNATAGDALRLGVLDASDAVRLLHVVATDAGMLEQPEPADEVVLPAGGRVEVLVDTAGGGRLRIAALPWSMNADGTGAGDTRTLLAVDVDGAPAPVDLPGRLGVVEELDPATAVRTRRIVLDVDGTGTPTLDGRTFDPDRVDLVATLGTLEVWEVVNDGPVSHPFHLHSYRVQVVDRDGAPEPYRAWRDTVDVPAGGTVRLAVPFGVGTGRTVFHCHIAAHEDMGMMGVLEVREA